MTYTANVPVSGQTLGNSRPIINQNFQQIAKDFAVNHIAFNDVGEGKHKFVEIKNGSVPASAAGFGTLYTKQIATLAGNVSQLYYTPDASGTEIALTSTNNSNGTVIPGAAGCSVTGHSSTIGTNFFTFLPGNVTVLSGTINAVDRNRTYVLRIPNNIFESVDLQVQLTGFSGAVQPQMLAVGVISIVSAGGGNIDITMRTGDLGQALSDAGKIFFFVFRKQ